MLMKINKNSIAKVSSRSLLGVPKVVSNQRVAITMSAAVVVAASSIAVGLHGSQMNSSSKKSIDSLDATHTTVSIQSSPSTSDKSDVVQTTGNETTQNPNITTEQQDSGTTRVDIRTTPNANEDVHVNGEHVTSDDNSGSTHKTIPTENDSTTVGVDVTSHNETSDNSKNKSSSSLKITSSSSSKVNSKSTGTIYTSNNH